MLKSVKFKKKYRCFKRGDLFEFRKGINLLVGDQGTGKSSLFGIIRELFLGKTDAKKLAKGEIVPPLQLLYYDFEKDNPRTQHYFDAGSVGFQLNSHFYSHGQTMNTILEGFVPLVKSVLKKNPKLMILVVFDEPDIGLSIRSCYKLIKILDQLVKLKIQVLCSIHNPLVMESVSRVLDVERIKWVKPSTYIFSQKK